jgi:hypothetical protein
MHGTHNFFLLIINENILLPIFAELDPVACKRKATNYLLQSDTQYAIRND